MVAQRPGWPVNRDWWLLPRRTPHKRSGGIVRGIPMDAKELASAFEDNAKTLPIEPITISTPNGPLQIDGLILGDWALNENSEVWMVTHRKSGYAGKNYSTPI